MTFLIRKSQKKLNPAFSGILRDKKTVADILMYIPNDDTQQHPFCRLQLVVETFGHSSLINQSKFNKSPQRC